MSKYAHERPSPEHPTVHHALLKAWQALLVNRLRPYALQQAYGTYRWVYGSVGSELLLAHLRGDCTVALSSTDAAGRCRWLCLDADEANALPKLVELATALAERGLPGFVEASRRGGHLWLLLDEPVPADVARRVVLHAVEELRACGVPAPAIELYPDATGAGALGHAVRLPLGIHRLTGRRYPLFDEQGAPCAFTSTEAAVRFLLAWPHTSAAELVRRDQDLSQRQLPAFHADSTPARSRGGTHSPVIRWVDARISPLDLLADLAPESAMRPVGRGFLGWCPFHDDQAPDAAGKPGTPSFYVVLDRRRGWSWRCFSSNCPQSWGPMRHSFELLQRLLGLTVRSAIVEACQRWPEADALRSSSSASSQASDAEANHDR